MQNSFFVASVELEDVQNIDKDKAFFNRFYIFDIFSNGAEFFFKNSNPNIFSIRGKAFMFQT